MLVERSAVRYKADRDLRKRQEATVKAKATQRKGVKQTPAIQAEVAGRAGAVHEGNAAGNEADGQAAGQSPAKRSRVAAAATTLETTKAGAAARREGSAATEAELPERAQTDGTCGGGDGFQRARVDIRDLCMSGLPFGDRRVVSVAKHLCGVATDLGLRALLTRKLTAAAAAAAPGAEPTETARAAAAGVGGGGSSDDDDWPGRGWASSPWPTSAAPQARAATGAEALGVQGVCVATCCHHCVTWRDYVARGFFQEVRFQDSS